MKTTNLNNRKRISLLTLAFLGLAVLLFVVQAYTAVNYSDLHGPYFTGNFAVEDSKPVEFLTVVSYNIWFGEDIDQALSELREIKSQNGLDIILLQEMDETGQAGSIYNDPG